MTTFYCSYCKRTLPMPANSIGTGYGVMRNGHKICYACAGKRDEKSMLKDGRATLYLTEDRERGGYKVINWPGSLSIHPFYHKEGRHNIAGVRVDFWFRFHGQLWHGVRYGHNTEIAYCKRIKDW